MHFCFTHRCLQPRTLLSISAPLTSNKTVFSAFISTSPLKAALSCCASSSFWGVAFGVEVSESRGWRQCGGEVQLFTYLQYNSHWQKRITSASFQRDGGGRANPINRTKARAITNCRNPSTPPRCGQMIRLVMLKKETKAHVLGNVRTKAPR